MTKRSKEFAFLYGAQVYISDFTLALVSRGDPIPAVVPSAGRTLPPRSSTLCAGILPIP